MASIIRPNDNDIAVFTTTGSFCEWIPTQDQVNALVWLNIATHGGQPGVLPAVPVPVSRGLFGALTLIGAPPTYPAKYAGPKTSPADFKRWVP